MDQTQTRSCTECY